MREILFKGIRVDNGEWVEGDLIQNYHHHDGLTIVVNGCIYHEVIMETVCQFTGLIDRNNTKIFEGDVFMSQTGLKITIEWQNDYCLYMMRWLTDDYQMKTDIKFINKSEVIGNIHDNNNKKQL